MPLSKSLRLKLSNIGQDVPLSKSVTLMISIEFTKRIQWLPPRTKRTGRKSVRGFVSLSVCLQANIIHPKIEIDI